MLPASTIIPMIDITVPNIPSMNTSIDTNIFPIVNVTAKYSNSIDSAAMHTKHITIQDINISRIEHLAISLKLFILFHILCLVYTLYQRYGISFK